MSNDGDPVPRLLRPIRAIDYYLCAKVEAFAELIRSEERNRWGLTKLHRLLLILLAASLSLLPAVLFLYAIVEIFLIDFGQLELANQLDLQAWHLWELYKLEV